MCQGTGILMCQGTGTPTYGGGRTQAYRHTGAGHQGTGIPTTRSSRSASCGRDKRVAAAGTSRWRGRGGCSSRRSQPRRGPGAGPCPHGGVRARVQAGCTGCKGGLQGPSAGSSRARGFGSGCGCGRCSAAPAVPPARGCRVSRRCRGGEGGWRNPWGDDGGVGCGEGDRRHRAEGEQGAAIRTYPRPVRAAVPPPPIRARCRSRCQSRCRSRRLPVRPAPSCRPPGAEPRGGAGMAASSPPPPSAPAPPAAAGRDPAVPGEGAARPGAALPLPSSSAERLPLSQGDLAEGVLANFGGRGVQQGGGVGWGVLC